MRSPSAWIEADNAEREHLFQNFDMPANRKPGPAIQAGDWLMIPVAG